VVCPSHEFERIPKKHLAFAAVPRYGQYDDGVIFHCPRGEFAEGRGANLLCIAQFSRSAPMPKQTPKKSAQAPSQVLQDRFLRLPDVRAKLADISRTTIYRMVAEKKFPAPYDLSSDLGEPRQAGRIVAAWLESEVNAWIASRTAARRNATPASTAEDRKAA
jgi:predicted DNA-binding transcriptional regulator AlpA